MASHKPMGCLGSLAEGVTFNASPFDSIDGGKRVIEVNLLGVYV